MRYWYRKPKTEIVDEFLFSDGDKTVSIVAGQSIDCSSEKSEKLCRLIECAEQLGYKYLGCHTSYNEIPGVKTKAVQQEEHWNKEFRNAIFYECGAQQYLETCQ